MFTLRRGDAGNFKLPESYATYLNLFNHYIIPNLLSQIKVGKIKIETINTDDHTESIKLINVLMKKFQL